MYEELIAKMNPCPKLNLRAREIISVNSTL